MLVLDGVTDPHNLGACLRVADGAGAHAVVAPKDHAVGLNATVAKVASGAAETVPYFMVTNLARTLGELKERDIRVVGTAEDAPRSIYELDLTGPVALVFGAEGSGMRQLTAKTCDELVHLPMHGAVESLNVSVASGVCLYEAARQRARARRGPDPGLTSCLMPVFEVSHPLVRHKVGLLREADLSTKSFREITAELGRLLTYEATADFPLERATVACWSGPVEVDRISGKKVTVVPILRAGLGMLEGVLDTIPNAKVSVVGIARNHTTLLPEPYVDRLAGGLAERTAIVLDPMLATGGSMISAISLLKARGATDMRALVLVAAPEGIAALTAAHPDVRCWTAAIDSHLDPNGYIIPGLGDAGDRIFGTR